ncbi:hypothetical protein [Polaribacter aestuariivivens]|uniref:hypothetical protein n=1 Tax=Polaribacter aestuariivivens TaxID=2304626 RepID=UPI003F496946
MKEQFKIIETLTDKQRGLFDKDIQAIYLECHKALNGKIQKLMDVTVNLNLDNEVYLKVICEYDNDTLNNKVKGKITHISKYKNITEYKQALAVERASLN